MCSATAEDMTPLFEKFGDVGDIFFPLERGSGRSRGFAFIRSVNLLNLSTGVYNVPEKGPGKPSTSNYYAIYPQLPHRKLIIVRCWGLVWSFKASLCPFWRLTTIFFPINYFFFLFVFLYPFSPSCSLFSSFSSLFPLSLEKLLNISYSSNYSPFKGANKEGRKENEYNGRRKTFWDAIPHWKDV